MDMTLPAPDLVLGGTREAAVAFCRRHGWDPARKARVISQAARCLRGKPGLVVAVIAPEMARSRAQVDRMYEEMKLVGAIEWRVG